MTNFIFKKRIAALAGLCLLFVAGITQAQTARISYQGKLNDGGVPANGVYDFLFKLYNVNGVQFSTDVPVNDVQVTNGIFNVLIPFEETPGIFLTGSQKFLEIAVRPGASTGAYTTLAPRQEFGSVPSAIWARNASDAAGAEYARNLSTSGGIISANQFVQTSDSRLSDARNPLAGSANYIQNGTGIQPTSNFNISATGTANIFNAKRFDLYGEKMLSSIKINGNLALGYETGDVGGGNSNTFIGTRSGQLSGAAGLDNTFLGFETGLNIGSGDNNSFIGSQSGRANTDGSGNVFFGYYSGKNNTTGSGNTFLGANSGFSSTTESNNTYIGNQSDGNSGITNATALGFRAFVAKSNAIVLGSVNGYNNATTDTDVGIGKVDPTYKLQVVDPLNRGLRVENNGSGGTVASFGSRGAFQIDANNISGGRFSVLENGNVGIGTNSPSAKLQVEGNVRVNNGFIYVTNPNTLIITSPNGACWGITVNNSGQLGTFPVTCP